MTDAFKIKVGENLRFFLETQGKSQKMLADYLNVSESTVSKYINGSRSPDVEQIVRIAFFFGTSTDELLTDKQGVHTVIIKANGKTIGRFKTNMPINF